MQLLEAHVSLENWHSKSQRKSQNPKKGGAGETIMYVLMFISHLYAFLPQIVFLQLFQLLTFSCYLLVQQFLALLFHSLNHLTLDIFVISCFQFFGLHFLTLQDTLYSITMHSFALYSLALYLYSIVLNF